MQAVRQFMDDSNVEIVVLVEGIDPVTSCTVQKRHSFTPGPYNNMYIYVYIAVVSLVVSAKSVRLYYT